jgi:PST family polysaccharide transporter
MDKLRLGVVTRATFWSGLERTLNRVVTLGIFIVLGRLLAPEHFGLAALAGIFTAFMQLFVDQGFSRAVVQRRSLEQRQLNTAFWTAVVTGTCLTAAGIAVAPVVSRLLGEPGLTPILRWLSAGFLLSSLTTTQQALLQREFGFRTLALRRLAATLVGGVAGIGLAASGAGVWSLVAQTITRSVVGAVVLWVASPWRPGLGVSREDFRDLFGFGMNVVGVEFLQFLTRQGDNLLVGAVLGPVALGFYTMAYRVLLVMNEVFMGTINQVVTPTFSRLQDDLEATRRAYYTALRLSQAVAVPAFVGVALLAPEIITVLFGARWAPSAPVMQALALVGLVQCSTYFDRGVLYAAGKPGLEFRITLVATIGNLAAFLVAVRWGIVAVAVALAIRNFAFWPVRIWALNRVAGIQPWPYLLQWSRPVAASVLMAAAVLGLRALFGEALATPLPLALTVLIATAAYLAALGLLAKDLTRELLRVARSLRAPREAVAA